MYRIRDPFIFDQSWFLELDAWPIVLPPHTPGMFMLLDAF